MTKFILSQFLPDLLAVCLQTYMSSYNYHVSEKFDFGFVSLSVVQW